MELSDFLITDMLAARPVSARRAAQLAGAVPAQLIGATTSVEQALALRCMQALELCGAHSAGISMFSPSGFDTLTWLGVSGELAPFDQHVFPRDNSPCGVCFTYRTAQLFRHPHVFFPWLAKIGIFIEELLVLPIQGPFGAFFGTMWVVTHHSAGPQFTLDDVHVLDKLGAPLWSRLRDLGSPNGQIAG